MLFSKRFKNQVNIKNKKPDGQLEGEIIKASLKALLIAGICLLSLVAAILAMNAWFVYNNQVDATGMQIGVKDTIHIDSYQVFKHNQPVTEGVPEYQIITDTTQKISFNNYDAVWGQEDTALYIRIVMHSDEFLADDCNGLKVSISRSSRASWKSSSDTGTKYFSSIACVSCKNYNSSSLPDKITAEKWYKALNSKFKNVTKYTFCDSAAKAYIKTTRSFSFTGSSFKKDGNQVQLYLRIDYDDALVKAYMGQTDDLWNIGNEYVNFDDFTQDIKKINFTILKTTN